MKRALLILALLSLAGCANMTELSHKQTKQRLMNQGQSEGYAEAYADGCQSGEGAAGVPGADFRKNVKAFSGYELYRQGWNDGFAMCKTEFTGR